MYFDARKAKALKDGEALAVDGCPGLRLLAQSTKRTWVYRYRSPLSNKLRQVTIGTWPAMPPIEAASRWQELRAQRDSGVDVAEERKQTRSLAKSLTGPSRSYTLGDMVEDYAERYLKVSREPLGAHAVASRLRRALAAKSLTKVLVTKVNRALAFDLIDSLKATPVAAGSVRVEMAAAWEMCASAGLIPPDLPNWFKSVPTRQLRSKGQMRDGKHKGTTKRVLREPELRTLFAKDLNLFSQQVQDFLTIQMWTCTRGGEICSMRAEDVTEEPDGLWWTVAKERGKLRHHDTAPDQRVPLVGRAEEVVRRLRSESLDWLFPSKTREGEHTYVKQPYMQSKVHYMQPYSKSRPDHVRKRLSVTHWSPHDLRRTGRTLLAAMGCPHEIAEALLGHVLPGVAGVYNLYTYDKEKRLWLSRLDQRLEEVIGAS